MTKWVIERQYQYTTYPNPSSSSLSTHELIPLREALDTGAKIHTKKSTNFQTQGSKEKSIIEVMSLIL
jgi:hypothetical protein